MTGKNRFQKVYAKVYNPALMQSKAIVAGQKTKSIHLCAVATGNE